MFIGWPLEPSHILSTGLGRALFYAGHLGKRGGEYANRIGKEKTWEKERERERVRTNPLTVPLTCTASNGSKRDSFSRLFSSADAGNLITWCQETEQGKISLKNYKKNTRCVEIFCSITRIVQYSKIIFPWVRVHKNTLWETDIDPWDRDKLV